MKNLFDKNILLYFLLIFILATLFCSCQDESKNEVLLASTIEFAVSEQNVNEGNAVTVSLVLDKEASSDGWVTISVETNAIFNQHFETDPAIDGGLLVILIEKGQKSADIQVSTGNNDLFEGSKFINFSLAHMSDEFKAGTLNSLKLTINDDEGPSLANFVTNAGIINEDNINGIVVPVIFSSPVLDAGSLKITINPANATYENDFITSPSAAANSITLNILPGETGTSFTVIPNHNYIATEDFQITFTISGETGAIKRGTSLSYSLTIINVDEEALVNFATNEGSLNEGNSAGIDVEIPFTAQAPGEGRITVSLTGSNATYGNQFTTVPAAAGNNTITLNVSNQQLGASFKVLPLNNSQCSNSERYIQFTISFANGSIMMGANLTQKLSLIDDEQISIVSFTESAGSVSESNGAGVAVQLNFSKPPQESGSIAIYSDWTIHQDRLTTTPAYECYWDCYYDCYWYCYGPNLPVNVGATNVMFNISPSNNSVDEPDHVADFFFGTSSSSGCLQAAPDSKYTLTIVDDD